MNIYHIIAFVTWEIIQLATEQLQYAIHLSTVHLGTLKGSFANCVYSTVVCSGFSAKHTFKSNCTAHHRPKQNMHIM